MTPDLDSGLDPELDPTHSPSASPSLLFPLLVDRFYASLIRHAAVAETGLGGQLLYLGELKEDGRAMMVAANIAGVASLGATEDPTAGKQATREGVADFLVTDLDEALRILKNEIRKREPVAVCVAALPASIEQEMIERGVLPDLVRDLNLNLSPGMVPEMNANSNVAGTSDSPRTAITFGGSPTPIAPVAPAQHESLLTWSVDESPAQWLPRLDALAMECLASDESASGHIGRRWLRFAPRYLGRLAASVHVLRCPEPTANEIASRMRASVQSGAVAIPVRIQFI
jgi:hypothetical protein